MSWHFFISSYENILYCLLFVNKLFTNIDNTIINTKEMYIDFNKVKTYFKTKSES